MPKKKKKKERQPNPILVPVDFSPNSESVLAWAADAAERYGLPLLVLHVVHDLAAAPGYYNSKKGRLRRLEETAGDMMKSFLKDFRKAHPELRAAQDVDVMLVTGLPVNRILEVAASCGAHHIVIGSQGRTGLPHLLLGSKAERVVQLSPIPVTIVKTVQPPGIES